MLNTNLKFVCELSRLVGYARTTEFSSFILYEIRLLVLDGRLSAERVNFICANNDSALIWTGSSEFTLFSFKRCDGMLLDEKGDRRAVYSSQMVVNRVH